MRTCLFIFLMLIAVAFSAQAEPYNPCQDHVCLVALVLAVTVGVVFLRAARQVTVSNLRRVIFY